MKSTCPTRTRPWHTQRDLYSTCSCWALEACVGSVRLRVGSARLFGYQHVGISNAKLSRWGSRPKQDPNASCFALQWNIGFRNWSLITGRRVATKREGVASQVLPLQKKGGGGEKRFSHEGGAHKLEVLGILKGGGAKCFR